MAYLLVASFFFLFSFFSFLLSCMICFKVPTASCSGRYGEKKTYKQIPRPASPRHGKNHTPQIHRKSPPRLAPKIKPLTPKETIHKNVQVERPKPFRRLAKTKEKSLKARNAGRGERMVDRRHMKTRNQRYHQNHVVRSGSSLHRSKALGKATEPVLYHHEG